MPANTLRDDATKVRERYAQAAQELKAGRVGEAASICHRALAAAGNEPNITCLLGEISLRQRRPQEAQTWYRKVLTRLPEYPRALEGMGLALLADGGPKEAVDCLQKAVDALPQRSATRFALARALAEGGPGAESAEAAREGFRMNPRKAALAKAEEAQLEGRLQEAEKILRKLLAEHPDDPRALRTLARQRQPAQRGRHPLDSALRWLKAAHDPEQAGLSGPALHLNAHRARTPTQTGNLMNKLIYLLLAIAPLSAVAEQPQQLSQHALKTFEIFKTIVEVDTSKAMGNTPRVARYLADELIAAGFPEEDIEILRMGDLAALIARYRGDGSSGKRPILFLGHMDVVEAYAKDWERPPFQLTSDDTNFYARGTIDNKFGVAQLTSTFIRLKKEGFVPTRDLILAFSGDEESGMKTTRMLAYERPDLAEAEFALNSDAGGGDLDANGKAITYNIQAAEKTYATWEITVRNPGGHSSRPREDNAIYDLAAAIKNIQGYTFPVQYSDMTRNYFKVTGEQLGGELGEAMIAFANDPNDPAAADRLAKESSYIGTTRTTCVVTMLQAGHAENALPQSATATVNCRIFPGVPVSEIQNTLQRVVDNPAVEFKQTYEATESPVSELREDVVDAVSDAVNNRYPEVQLIAYMESGGTDGMHFRRAGIPTWAVSGIFMNPDEMYAHGLNERVPIKAFYDALDHWSVIIHKLAGP